MKKKKEAIEIKQMAAPNVGTMFDVHHFEILGLFVGIDLGWLGSDVELGSIKTQISFWYFQQLVTFIWVKNR